MIPQILGLEHVHTAVVTGTAATRAGAAVPKLGTHGAAHGSSGRAWRVGGQEEAGLNHANQATRLLVTTTQQPAGVMSDDVDVRV